MVGLFASLLTHGAEETEKLLLVLKSGVSCYLSLLVLLVRCCPESLEWWDCRAPYGHTVLDLSRTHAHAHMRAHARARTRARARPPAHAPAREYAHFEVRP